MRYERKFTINTLSIYQVEYIIRKNPLCFKEVFYPRYINNIYFDSFNRKSWNENTEGNTNRVKARIRWYGEFLGNINSPALELKVKQGLLGKKPTYKLCDFLMDSKISKNQFHNIFKDSSLPIAVLQSLIKLEPSVANRYKRKYYLSHNKKFRLTVDTELVYYRINSGKSNFNRLYRDDDNVIIEIKYEKEDDNLVDEITNSFPFRISKKSKYVSGIHKTKF